MSSFYGGPAGQSFNITKYHNLKELKTKIQNLVAGDLAIIHYGDYSTDPNSEYQQNIRIDATEHLGFNNSKLYRRIITEPYYVQISELTGQMVNINVSAGEPVKFTQSPSIDVTGTPDEKNLIFHLPKAQGIELGETQYQPAHKNPIVTQTNHNKDITTFTFTLPNAYTISKDGTITVDGKSYTVKGGVALTIASTVAKPTVQLIYDNNQTIFAAVSLPRGTQFSTTGMHSSGTDITYTNINKSLDPTAKIEYDEATDTYYLKLQLQNSIKGVTIAQDIEYNQTPSASFNNDNKLELHLYKRQQLKGEVNLTRTNAGTDPNAEIINSDTSTPQLKLTLPKSQKINYTGTSSIAANKNPEVTYNDTTDVNNPKLSFKMPKAYKIAANGEKTIGGKTYNVVNGVAITYVDNNVNPTTQLIYDNDESIFAAMQLPRAYKLANKSVETTTYKITDNKSPSASLKTKTESGETKYYLTLDLPEGLSSSVVVSEVEFNDTPTVSIDGSNRLNFGLRKPQQIQETVPVTHKSTTGGNATAKINGANTGSPQLTLTLPAMPTIASTVTVSEAAENSQASGSFIGDPEKSLTLSLPKYGFYTGTTTTSGSTTNASLTINKTNNGHTNTFNFTIPRGSRWYKGEEAPSNTLGENGDYYLQTVTPYKIYYKDSNIWSYNNVYLKGETGESIKVVGVYDISSTIANNTADYIGTQLEAISGFETPKADEVIAVNWSSSDSSPTLHLSYWYYYVEGQWSRSQLTGNTSEFITDSYSANDTHRAYTANYINNHLVHNTGGTINGNLSLNNHKITNIAEPTSTTDAANKQYVDNAIDDIQNKLIIDNIPTENSNNLVKSGGVKSYVDGSYTIAGQKSGTTLGTQATAEGRYTTASGNFSHAEGYYTMASGDHSHAEGYYTTASGNHSHAEGYYTTASGEESHAEGDNATASGDYSHAEGRETEASGKASHAEGYDTVASGIFSHAEGYYTTASGDLAHAEGYYTTARHKSQHVFGEYNVLDTEGTVSTHGAYVEIVGNGTSTSARSNARTLDWSGNETLAGKLTLGAAPSAAMDAATKKYVDNAIAGIQDSLIVDDVPTNGSDNLVKSGGVYSALSKKQGTLTFDSTPTSNSSNPVTSNGIKAALDKKAPLASPSFTGTVKIGDAALSNSNSRLYLGSTSDPYIDLTNHVLYGAAWNDYAETRKAKENYEAGRVVIEAGDGSVTLATSRLQPCGSIVSDTYGMIIGHNSNEYIPTAISGRVLAYCNENRDEYQVGDVVCTGPNGTVSKMTREEIQEYPDRIIGKVSEVPQYNTWNNIQINGRIWIKL